jgi:hypothetical protein
LKRSRAAHYNLQKGKEMNMQTVKARAKWLVGGDPQLHKMWEVSHPDTGIKMWSCLPHDAALEIIKFGLHSQIEPKLQPI